MLSGAGVYRHSHHLESVREGKAFRGIPLTGQSRSGAEIVYLSRKRWQHRGRHRVRALNLARVTNLNICRHISNATFRQRDRMPRWREGVAPGNSEGQECLKRYLRQVALYGRYDGLRAPRGQFFSSFPLVVVRERR